MFDPPEYDPDASDDDSKAPTPEPTPLQRILADEVIEYIEGAEGSKIESERIILQKTKKFESQYFQESRHIEKIEGLKETLDEDIWIRYNGKDRMKTVSVALVLCLHLGVDPPDPEPRPKKRAKLECWVDPSSASPFRVTNQIAYELQHNYGRWQPRARYKVAIDPTTEELKKICMTLRKNAKDERILFHYNGHGVPRPTKNGEIWVFNKTFTQYIPLSLSTLQQWLEFPCIYVWDCNSAGNIVNAFYKFVEMHEDEYAKAFEEFSEKYPAPLPQISSNGTYHDRTQHARFSRPPLFQNCVHLAACNEDQRLPVDPRLPADLFTCCLTTPIQASLVWYMIKKGVRDQYPEDVIMRVPGQLTDRRTMLGELNWIFTAITDTIAWNSLPRELFQRLFRQDLLLASLFRSFLLAEKIMGFFGCDVVSKPSVPPVSDHPLWASWELTLDQALDQLDKLFYHQGCSTVATIGDDIFSGQQITEYDVIDKEELLIGLGEAPPHWFFLEQMQGFDMWLEYSQERMHPPQQLPVVLQVLLSQAHRTRALELLAKFLDMGLWAVGFSLSVGIFPYILKLLQSSQRDLKPWLSFIWAKILSIEPYLNEELFKEIGDDNVYNVSQRPENKHLRYIYFLQILNDPGVTARQKVMTAYVLAMLFYGPNRYAQSILVDKSYVTLCTEILAEPATKECHMLRLWLLIGMGRLWTDFNIARWQAVRLAAHRRIMLELVDPVPEVRAAAIYSLGCLMKNHSHTNEHATVIDQEVADSILFNCCFDGSVLVREEALIALQYFIIDFSLALCKNYHKLLRDLRMNIETEMMDEEIDESVDVAAEMTAAEERHKQMRKLSWRRTSSALFQPQATIVRHPIKEEVLDLSDPNIPFGPAQLSQRDRVFRIRCLKQIGNLERRNFKDPVERIWLGLLRMTLDPFKKVGSLAQFLVRQIEEAALELHVSTERRLATSASLNSFVINGRIPDIGPDGRTYYSPAPPSRKSSTVAAPKKDKSHDDHDSGLELSIDRRLREKSIGGEKSQITFTIGSPNGTMPHPQTPLSKPPLNTVPSGAARDYIRNATRQGKHRIRLADFDRNSILANTHHFTPKRTMGGRIGGSEFKAPKPHPGAPAAHEPLPIQNPIIHNEFPDWCSKVFADPVLHLVMRDVTTDGIGDSMTVKTNPTFWAHHLNIEQREKAENEFEVMRLGFRSKKTVYRNTKQVVECNSQLLATKTERPAIGVSFSQLRPYLYATDGEFVTVHKYDSGKCRLVRKFHNYGDNNFMTDKSSWIQMVNPMSNEMVLVGSSNGTVRLWDFGFDSHSDEMRNEQPKLMCSFNPLASAMRFPFDVQESTRVPALYQWEQECGRLVASGAVRVVRIWDAHAERVTIEVTFDHKLNGCVTGVASDFTGSHLFAVAFNDGHIRLYDERISVKESHIMQFDDHQDAVKGMALRTHDGKTILASADAERQICVYEPRMYKDPVVVIKCTDEDVDVPDHLVTHFDVHQNGQLMAAAFPYPSPEIRLFDISGIQMARIRTNDIAAKPITKPTAIAFHPTRPVIAVGTQDKFLSAYGLPAK